MAYKAAFKSSARFCSVMSRYEAYAPTFLPFTITGEVESSTSTRMPSFRRRRVSSESLFCVRMVSCIHAVSA